MDPITRELTIKALKEHLNASRLQYASLDNNAHQRREMAQTCDAIQLLLDFLENEQKRERL